MQAELSLVALDDQTSFFPLLVVTNESPLCVLQRKIKAATTFALHQLIRHSFHMKNYKVISEMLAFMPFPD